MKPDIFIDDFEITENTENIHAILGRCLIFATRFDNLCDHAAKFLNLKSSCVAMLSREKFDEYVTSLFSKFSILNSNINTLPIGESEKDILHKARFARNEIAHSLAVGMTGCLDTKINERDFEKHALNLVAEISEGDYLISSILSILNKDSLPKCSVCSYTDRVLTWVKGA